MSPPFRLDLAFWAESEADARQKAEEWIAAEPNVEAGQIVACQKKNPTRWSIPISETWRVTVDLTMRQSEAEPLTRGLTA